MKSISTAITLLLAASLPHSNVLATPTGAGSCATGKTAISNAPWHGGGTGGKTFAASNLVLMWGGDALDPTGTNTIGAATDHTFTLTTTDGSKFMGFLLRLSGKNGATASSTTTFVAADSSLAQVSDLCASGVIGITHRSSDGKPSITVTLNHPEAAELLLEVTVVTTNQSNWSYDAFGLLVSGDDAATTPPTVPPTSPTSLTSPTQESGSAILGLLNVMMLGVLFVASFAML